MEHKGKLLQEFNYTGGVQTITLAPGRYCIECYGAQGGGSTGNSNYGSRGGFAYGELLITKTTPLYVFVGGRGTSGNGNIDSGGGGGAVRNYGGYNGGGRATGGGAGGGGMTHVSTTNNRCPSNSNGGWNPAGTLIVAGGGGGDSTSASYLGFSSSGYQGTGENACTSRHSSRYPNDESGGGGGWYGGAVIHGDDPRRSYSGQNYTGSLDNPTDQYDVQSGNGYCAIYYYGHIITTMHCSASLSMFVGGENIQVTAPSFADIDGHRCEFRRFYLQYSDNMKNTFNFQITDRVFSFVAPYVPLEDYCFVIIEAIYERIRANSNYYRDSHLNELVSMDVLIE